MIHAPDPTPTARVTTAASTLIGLGAAALLLTLTGRSLPFPGSWAPGDVQRWVGATDPAVVAFTTLRAMAVALVAWLALTWLFGVLARLARMPAAVRAADGLALPLVRRLAEVTAGAAIVAVSLAPVAQAGAAIPDTSPLVVMSDLGPTSPGTTTTTLAPTTTVAVVPPSMTGLDDDAVAPARPTGPPAADHTVASPAPDHASGVWVIRAGDTLWHVAEHTAGDGLGRPATLAETAVQLDRLIQLNADRLVVPGDADLVFPGQEFLVP